MALKLIYKDVALGADVDATPSATAAESFSNIALLPFGAETPAVATLEGNGWGLGGDYELRDGNTFAFWSVERSGADCVFSTPPALTFNFTEQYTSTGLTITFARESMDYCAEVEVLWYQDGAIKHSGRYYPEAPEFILEQTVEAYDAVKILFHKTSLPGKRAKVQKVTFGVIRTFDGKELTGASIIQEVDLISDTVPANVLDATLRGDGRGDYVFQRKQPVEAYSGDDLLGVFYVEKGNRTGWSNYTVSCTDAVGVLALDEYAGGIWINNTPLDTILAEVFGDAFEFDVDPAFATATLRGFIEPGTKRDALRAIAFALGAVVDTAGTRKIKLFPMPTGEGAEIPAANTYVGGSVDIGDKVTEVTVTAYIITDERPGENEESVELDGVNYRYYTDTKHAYNPNAVANDPPNKIKFQKNYLVNLGNAQRLADSILAYYMRREKYRFKHILDTHTTGDRATATLPWGGTVAGNFTKLTISATGLVVGDVEMVLD